MSLSIIKSFNVQNLAPLIRPIPLSRMDQVPDASIQMLVWVLSQLLVFNPHATLQVPLLTWVLMEQRLYVMAPTLILTISL